MSTLSNDHLGEEDGYERIDITIWGPWRVDPVDNEYLSAMVMRVNRPKPHEIKQAVAVKLKGGIRFKLFVKRDPCPVRYTGEKCPICRKPHPK